MALTPYCESGPLWLLYIGVLYSAPTSPPAGGPSGWDGVM